MKVKDSRQKHRALLRKMMPAKPNATDRLVLQSLLELERRGLIVPIETDDGSLQFFLPYADSAVRRRAIEQAEQLASPITPSVPPSPDRENRPHE